MKVDPADGLKRKKEIYKWKETYFFFTSVSLVMQTDSEEYLFEFNNWASNILFFNSNVFIERNTTVYNF